MTLTEAHQTMHHGPLEQIPAAAAWVATVIWITDACKTCRHCHGHPKTYTGRAFPGAVWCVCVARAPLEIREGVAEYLTEQASKRNAL